MMRSAVRSCTILACLVAVWLASGPASAWSFAAGASSSCVDTTARITVTFTNQEHGRANSITVLATDAQTGRSVSLGPVAAGQNVQKDLDSGRTTLTAGTVALHETWSNGRRGTDDATLHYRAVDCTQPPPMLSDGLNGLTLLGLAGVAAPVAIYWTRRRSKGPVGG